MTVSLQKKQNVWTVIGIHGSPLEDSLENLNRFTLWGKGLNQYVTLFLAVSSLAFSFYAVVVCFRTRVGPARWLWVPFILAGVGQLSVNWTTGELYLKILTIHVPSASANADIYGPWMIWVCLPFGAIVFLNEHWRDKARGEPDPDREVRLAIDSLRRK